MSDSYCERMFITGVLCVLAAVASEIFGVRSLNQADTANPAQLARRAIAPTQLAASVMLIVGGGVALVASQPGTLMVVLVCIAGAVGTLAAGSLQTARYAVRHNSTNLTSADCAGNCTACTLSCR